MTDTLEKAFSHVRTVLGTLKRRSLLLDGKYENTVKVHDVVRDVAISIAEDEKSFLVKHSVRYWPEKDTCKDRLVISLMLHDMSEFPNELVCPELHTFRLDCTINKFELHVPDGFFSGMEKLLVLDLKGVIMSPLVPTSLTKLAKLQMLCLNRCNLGDIATLKDLKDHLEILSLRGSNIEVLPQEIGELALLRLLDMSDCHKLGMIRKGVISKLLRLEELYMPPNFHQWEGTSAEREQSSVSLDELTLLTRLTTLHICIQDPALLPEDNFCFENLVRFRITIGAANSYFNWDPPGVLRLEKVHIANALEYLLAKPKHEWSIERNGLYPSTSFNHLGKLCVTNCMLKYLFSPSSVRGLVRLKQLEITRCIVMEGVIGTEGEKDEDIMINFTGLEYLNLEDLPILVSFYPKKEKTATNSESSSTRAPMVLFNDKVAFPKLDTLHVGTSGERALRQLMDASELSLKFLHFEDCDEVSTVVSPHLFRSLRLVEKLGVFDCRGAREVFHFDEQEVGEGQLCIGPSTQVCHLQLRNLDQLTCLWNKDPHRLLVLQSLESLTIYYCPLLANLLTVSVAKALGGLKQLNLGYCSTIEEVIAIDEGHADAIDDDEIEFPKLEQLTLRHLSHLKSFCSSNHDLNFPSLEAIFLEKCPKLQAFTSGSVRMSLILYTGRRNNRLEIEDLNKHLQQQHLEGEETILEDEIYGGDVYRIELFKFRSAEWNH